MENHRMRSVEIPKRTPDDPPKQRKKKTPEREKRRRGAPARVPLPKERRRESKPPDIDMKVNAGKEH